MQNFLSISTNNALKTMREQRQLVYTADIPCEIMLVLPFLGRLSPRVALVSSSVAFILLQSLIRYVILSKHVTLSCVVINSGHVQFASHTSDVDYALNPIAAVVVVQVTVFPFPLYCAASFLCPRTAPNKQTKSYSRYFLDMARCALYTKMRAMVRL